VPAPDKRAWEVAEPYIRRQAAAKPAPQQQPEGEHGMCDQDHFEEDLKKYSRRDVGTLAAAVGLAAMLPHSAFAVDVKESDVTIKTPDGECDAYFVAPSTGAHAAVLVWPDIFGLRPAMRQMGKRLAEEGYSVLVVNPFYRQQKAPTAPQGAATPIQQVLPMMQALNATTHTTDAKAFISWLDSRSEVDKGKKIGTIGYCMGGPIVVRTAAAVPNRVGAVGSFHGGGLTTMGPDSPHLLIPQTKAQYLIAVAENDDMRDPESKNILKKAFADAKLNAEVEVYKAAHGWCPPDTQVYNRDEAERAWNRMMAMFQKALA
jgi:carboxymethylenebutenolidase